MGKNLPNQITEIEKASFAVLQNGNAVLRSVDAIVSQIVAGDSYIVTTRERNLGNNVGMNLLIENPTGSGKRVLALFIIDTEGKLNYNSYCDMTVTSKAELTPTSLLIPSTGQLVAKVYNEVIYTGGNMRSDDLIPLGSGGQARGGSSNTVFTCINEGCSILTEITNISGQTRDVGFKVQITEF